MRNLYLRIFVSFWIAMVLALSFTVMATLWLGDQRAQREQSRQAQQRREPKDRARRHPLAARSQQGGADRTADRRETRVAPQPFGHRRSTHQAQS